MKLITYVLFLCSFICFACETNIPVFFKEAQPASSGNLSAFGKGLQGKYLHKEDSSVILINDHCIIEVNHYQWHFHRSELDSSEGVNIHDDRSILSNMNREGIQGRIINDTVYASFMAVDTIFRISDGNLLRKLQDNYFLNKQLGDDTWDVTRLNVINDRYLCFSKIYPDSLYKFEKMAGISEVKDDSGKVISYYLQPKRKELKNLIREDAFHREEKLYLRME